MPPTYKFKDFSIKPSTRLNKKYDVFKNNTYITSFGDKRYQHYKDKFGFYSHLDHLDPKRREAYKARHKNDNIDDPQYAGYWALKFLW